MTRRLRIAGTAFGAMLVPACAGLPPDPPTIKPVNPPIPTAAGYRPTPALLAGQPTRPRTIEKFAAGRPDAMPTVAHVATPAANPPAANPPAAESPAEPAPVEHVATAPAAVAMDPPRLVLPTPSGSTLIPPAEPVPDAEGIIRSPWPVIKGLGSTTEPLIPVKAEAKEFMPAGDAPPRIGPMNLPLEYPPTPVESIPGALVPPPVIPPAAPAALPPGVIGTSVHQSHASPVGAMGVESPLPAEMTSASAPAADSPLVMAVRALEQNRPDEAVEHLKAYDPVTQQILLALMPAEVRISEGRLGQMKPEEVDAIIEQLTRVPVMLRPRASLLARNVRLCREVHNFAHIEPFPDRHTFRPGDIVYLYMELANFSPVPDPKGGFTITVASSLELRDSAGKLVWGASPKDVPDRVSTPPQDYYRNFRLSVPTVPPGVYMLMVKATDRPTGREVRKAVEMRIGAR